jgi:hypothetical protein
MTSSDLKQTPPGAQAATPDVGYDAQLRDKLLQELPDRIMSYLFNPQNYLTIPNLPDKWVTGGNVLRHCRVRRIIGVPEVSDELNTMVETGAVDHLYKNGLYLYRLKEKPLEEKPSV